MNELAEDLYASHPDVIVLISEHPTIFEESFSLSVSDPYKFDMSEFGILSINHVFHPDLRLIDRLQRTMRKKNQNVILTTDEKLNYASAVPLILLTKNLRHVKLVPVAFSQQDPKTHFAFGQALKDAIINSDKRVAVIASGDLSHTLTSNSPAGFHEDGQIFDNKIQELITHKNTAGLLSMDAELVVNAQQIMYRSLTILFGLLERISVTPHILSYEAPFGVGYLVANLEIK